MMKLLVLSCLAAVSESLDMWTLIKTIPSNDERRTFRLWLTHNKVQGFTQAKAEPNPNWMMQYEHNGAGLTPVALAIKLEKWNVVEVLIEAFLSSKKYFQMNLNHPYYGYFSGNMKADVFFNRIKVDETKNHFEFAMDQKKFKKFVEIIEDLPKKDPARFSDISSGKVIGLFEYALKNDRSIATITAVMKLAALKLYRNYAQEEFYEKYAGIIASFQVKNGKADNDLLALLVKGHKFNYAGVHLTFAGLTEAQADKLTNCSIHQPGICKNPKHRQACTFPFQKLFQNKNVTDANIISIFNKLSNKAKMAKYNGEDYLTLAVKNNRSGVVSHLIKSPNLYENNTDSYLILGIEKNVSSNIIRALVNDTPHSFETTNAIKKAIEANKIDALDELIKSDTSSRNEHKCKTYIKKLASGEDSYLKHKAIIKHIMEKNYFDLQTELEMLTPIKNDRAPTNKAFLGLKRDVKELHATLTTQTQDRSPTLQASQGLKDTTQTQDRSPTLQASQGLKDKPQGGGAFFNGLSIALLAVVTAIWI